MQRLAPLPVSARRAPRARAQPARPVMRSGLDLPPPKARPAHACPAERLLDGVLEQGLHLAPYVPGLPKVAQALAAQRRQTVADLVVKLAPAVAALAPEIEAGDAAAICHYDQLMDAAIQTLRSAKDGSLRDALVEIDHRTRRPGVELSDDPTFPMHERLRILDTLHRFNIATRNYERWGNKLLPWVHARHPDAGPLSVVDLAAGTGGFAVALKQRFGNRVRMTATDLIDAFLESGAAQARARGTDVTFAPQDVTKLREMRDKGVDVFTCTQSLHHFTPGELGRMLGEARQAAGRGLLFIDGERGLLLTALVTLSMAAYGRDYPVVHDTFVSLCRMYVAEEMELLARLAPGITADDKIETGRLSPGHLFVRLEKSRAQA